jgi:hypothetical protein
MGMQKSPVIEILNWKRFNPRGDVKRPSWFRLEHDMISSSQFYDLTDAEFRAWIYLMSERNKRRESVFEVNLDHAERVCRVKSAAIFSALEKLERMQIVLVHVTGPSRARDEVGTSAIATDGRTYVRDETDEDSSEHPAPPKALEPTSIPEFSDSKTLIEAFEERNVSLDSQRLWLEVFPDPSWVKMQLLLAIAWEKANPRRKKKNFAAFVNRWLAKDWDRHTAAIPASGVTPIRPKSPEAERADREAAELAAKYGRGGQQHA